MQANDAGIAAGTSPAINPVRANSGEPFRRRPGATAGARSPADRFEPSPGDASHRRGRRRAAAQRRRPGDRPAGAAPGRVGALDRLAGFLSPISTPPTRARIRQQLDAQRLIPVDLSAEEIKRYYESYANGVLWPLFHYLSAQLPLEVQRLRGLRGRQRALRRDRRAGVAARRLDLGARLPATAGARHVAPPAAGCPHRLLPAHPVPVVGGVPLAAESRARAGRHARRRSRRLPHGRLRAPLRVERAARARHRELRSTGSASRGARSTSACSRWASTPPLSRRPPPSRASIDEALTLRGEPETQLLLGVDRLDYTKGIPRRLLAYERLLDESPGAARQGALRAGGGAVAAGRRRLPGVPPRGGGADRPHPGRLRDAALGAGPLDAPEPLARGGGGALLRGRRAARDAACATA